MTINCFFKSGPKVVKMIKKTTFLVNNGKISESSYKKAATIYESVVNDTIDYPMNEIVFFEAFHEFIIGVFEFEREVSGVDYLASEGPFGQDGDDREKGDLGMEQLNSVITEVTEEDEESIISKRLVSEPNSFLLSF